MKRYYIDLAAGINEHTQTLDELKETARTHGAFRIRTAYCLGMNNQPRVVTFDMRDADIPLLESSLYPRYRVWEKRWR